MLVVGSLVAVGVMYPNTVETRETFSRGKPQVYKPERSVTLRRDDRAHALATAANFLKTAVVRRNVERSWELTAPELREGYTQAEWAAGDIPVVPYPVATARWKLDYSYRDAIGLQVLLYPRARTGLRPNVFLMELRRMGSAGKRRWLVDSWVPSGVASPNLQPQQPLGGGTGGLPAVASSVEGEARLGAAWLLVPLGLLGIAPLALAGFALRSWLRSRRAVRAYELGRQSAADLPSYRHYTREGR